MSDMDQKKENADPNYRTTDTNSRPTSGRALALVIVSLLVGVVVVLLLMVLRANERNAGAQYPDGAKVTTLTPAAEHLSLLKLSSEEIKSWVAQTVQKSGSKIGVVNIWATWCAPCRDEMPELAKFQREGVAPMLLISADNELDEAPVRTFLNEMTVDFESVLIKGDQQEFIEHWQKLSSKDPAKQWSMTLPATFLVDASGDVVSFSIGTTSSEQLKSLVKKTLDTMRD